MIRFALTFFFVLCSCAHSASSWPSPSPTLQLNPLEARPPQPSVPLASPTPPRFPSVGERRLPGAKLWLVSEPGTGQVTIRVTTRRGNDGAYDEENLWAMLVTLQEMLKARLPGYRVTMHVSAHAIALRVVVRSADATTTLRAIGEVLDGPIDEALARRFLSDRSHDLLDQDHLRPHLFSLSSVPLAFSSPDALELCRDERFSSSDRLITLVGDFDTRNIIATGVHVFAAAKEVPRVDPGELALIRAERVSVTLLDDESFSVSLTLAAPGPRHEHFDVFELLLSMAQEPLPMRHTDHLGVLPPTLRSSLNIARPGDIAFLSVGGPPSHAEQLIEALFRHFRQLITRPFSARALERGRALHWANTQADLDDDATNVLTVAFIRHLIPSQLEARYRALEELTPELLLDMTRFYFAPGRIIVGVIGPRRALQPLIVIRNGNGFRLRVDPPALAPGQN